MATNEEKDTIQMADIMMENQGYHEMEVSFGGELDLHRRKRKCNKNPNHKLFIPVKDFNTEHLPGEYQDKDIVDMVKAGANMTVRLSVEGISKDRPEFFDDNKSRPFPFYKYRGRGGMMTTGTGWVKFVNSSKLRAPKDEPCKCNECVSSDTPKKMWGSVDISTAAHVVSDDIEAAHTTCHFFYDGQADLSTVPTLSGFKVNKCTIKGDHCELTCYTHDMDLLDKLKGMWWIMKDLEENVMEKYKDKNKGVISRDLDATGRLAICISHPHGCAKVVTVGRVTHRQTIEKVTKGLGPVTMAKEFTQFTYNCGTCPGSSGSNIYILGINRDARSNVDRYGLYHSHSGSETPDGGNRNISTISEELL